MDLKITKTENSRIGELQPNKLGFGKVFADHMFSMEYSGGAWRNPEITPYGPVPLYPATLALHYGQAIFEGIKAFDSRDDKINLFRPQAYIKRFNRSCRKLCIPEMDEEVFLEALKALVDLDRKWVPRGRGFSLYIRPFAFASDPNLGVKVSDTYRFMIITSPVGSYYGKSDCRLVTMPEYVRAFPGGLGSAKTLANYASSLLPAEEAKKQGFDQVLWLDGVEGKYIEEVGTMNIFALIGDVLVTPELGGTILGGITRDSVLALARHWGLEVEERRLAMDEIVDASRHGTLKEVFGTGTAAVIAPVTEIKHKDKLMKIPSGGEGSLSKRLFDEITGIQYGERKDYMDWIVKV